MDNSPDRKKKPTPNSKFKFICENCSFYNNNRKDFKRHLTTAKHMKKRYPFGNNVKFLIKKKKKSHSYTCKQCGKSYKHSSGLSKHKHKCGINTNKTTYFSIEDTEEVTIGKEEEEITKIIEKDKNIQGDIILTMLEVIKKQQETAEKTNAILKQQTERATNVYNNCQTKNQQFNINLYLNSECKDAMNLTDFVNNVKVTLEDLKFTTLNGYEKGITHLITKHLKDMPVTERPIHCSGDNKHIPQFYVKDENKWEEDKEHKKLDKSIHDVSMKQIQHLKEWERVHPNYKNNDNLMAVWHKMVAEILGACSVEEKEIAKNNIKKSLAHQYKINENLLDNK